MTETLYQVKNWEKCFEGVKSKGYGKKSSCMMPNKTGLGYKRLIRSKNGAALFGAWCALVQLLSRHQKPRHGYITDTGRIPQGYQTDTAIPDDDLGVLTTEPAKVLHPEDLELLTDIPASIFEELFTICLNNRTGWIEKIQATDTVGIPDGYHEDVQCPLNLNSNLNSNPNPNSTVEPVETRRRDGNDSPVSADSPDDSKSGKAKAPWHGVDYSAAEVPQIDTYDDLAAITDPVLAAMAVTGDHSRRGYGFWVPLLEKAVKKHGKGKEALDAVCRVAMNVIERVHGENSAGECSNPAAILNTQLKAAF